MHMLETRAFMRLLALALGLKVVMASDPTWSTSLVTVTVTTDVPTSLPSSLSLLVGSIYTSRGHIRTTSLPTVSVSQVATTVHLPQISTSPVPIFIPPHIDTHLTPAFAVGGALLILTGLPMAFYGHKNRWSSLFLIGVYTTSLTTIILILRFGVLQGVKPPTPKLQGIFLLAAAIAGILGGAGFIFFWRTTRYLIGAWGGFAFSLWIQTFHSNGAIKSSAGRWAFYITFAVVAFCLCTVPKIHLRVNLASTAMVGSTAFVLGLDCLTTAGLKEFYMSNLGLGKLFPILGGHFHISQMMIIEIVLMGGVALMGGAVQLRLLDILLRRMAKARQVKEVEERNLEAKSGKVFKAAVEDRKLWEREHGDGLPSQDVEKGLQKNDTSNDDIPSLPFSATNPVDQNGVRRLCESPVEDSTENQDRLNSVDEHTSTAEHDYSQRPSSSSLMPLVPESSSVSPTSWKPIESLPVRPPRALPPDRRRGQSWEAPTLLGDSSNFGYPAKRNDLDQLPFNEPQDGGVQPDPNLTPRPRPYSDIVVPASPAVAEALERRRIREAAILSPQFPDLVRRSDEVSPIPPTPIPPMLERRSTESRRTPRERPEPLSGLRRSLSDARQSFSGIRIIPDIPFKPQQRRQTDVPSPVKPVRNVTLGELDARHKEKLRALQGTVSGVESEQAEVGQARSSWKGRQSHERDNTNGQRKSLDADGNRRTSGQADSFQKRKSQAGEGIQEMSGVKDATVEPSSSGPSRDRRPFSTSPPGTTARREKRRSPQSLEAWNFFTSPGAPPKPAPN